MKANVSLNSGQKMPIQGLGTFCLQNVEEVVFESIKRGIRLFDTAEYYDNEAEIGKGISRAITEGFAAREELFIISKLWPKSFNNAEETILNQLSKLKVDYIDLYLIHFPFTIKEHNLTIRDVWTEFEGFYKKGYAKSIGVCNFNVQSLMDLLVYCKIVPAVNEVEFHPYLHQEALLKFCNSQGIQLIAYNSLVKGRYAARKSYFKDFNLLEESVLVKLAEKYNVKSSHIALNWSMSQGVTIIPKSNSIERIEENFKAADFQLNPDEIDQVSSLNRNVRFCLGDFEINGFTNIFA